MKFIISVWLAALPLAAQGIKMPAGIDKLAAKASEVVDVSLDGSLLNLASGFLSEKDPDEAKVKKMVGGLKGIYVKSFEFDEAGQYKESDVEEFRAQLHAPGWSRIVGAMSKKKGENSEVYLKTESNQITGLAVLVTDPKELTIVSIVGSIRPEELRDLGGHMGIPKMNFAPTNTDKKDKKEDDHQ